MTVGTIATQGTELFMIETASASDPVITKMACPTGITGLGGPKDQIEDTCLDTTDDKTYKAGLGNPGQVSVPFNLIPRDGSHQFLFVLKAAGTVLKWIACLSESATDPTMDTDLEFVAPTDRSSFKFDAYISDVNIDIANNEIVRGTLTLQRSGAVTFFGYTPA
jgi:tail tube protein